jgi:phosphatidylglycerophosphate synthase
MRLGPIPTAPTDRIQIAVDGQGPRFLGLSTGERNRRVAHRAEAHQPQLAGMLRIPDDVALTPVLFDHLPRTGTWHVVWHRDRPPLAWQAEGTIGLPRPVVVPQGSVLDVSTPAARRASAWQLVRRSGKPTDGWLARNIHRKISRAVSYVLLQSGLQAPHAMLLTAAIGLASAWLMAQTSRHTMIEGVLLLWFASITGGIDGEMARLSLSESSHGQQLDTALNHVIHVLCYAGIMVGWWRQGIGPGGAVLAFGVALALPATLLLSMHLVRKASGAGHLLVETRPIEFALLDAAHATGSRSLRLTAAAFVMFRRDSFPLICLAVSLVTGSRAVFAVIVAASLLFVLLTFLFYVKPIEAMMRHRFATPS